MISFIQWAIIVISLEEDFSKRPVWNIFSFALEKPSGPPIWEEHCFLFSAIVSTLNATKAVIREIWKVAYSWICENWDKTIFD